MKVIERKGAPWRTQHAEPCDAVLRIEQGAAKRQRIENLRAVFQLLEFNGAEGNSSFAQCGCDGLEGCAGAAQDGDAVLAVFASSAGESGFVDLVLLATNEGNNLRIWAE